MDLTSIADFCSQNIPGTLFVEYAPIEWVNSDSFYDWYVTNSNLSEFPWAGAYNWLKLPLLGSSIRWKEEMVDTPDGSAFKHQIGGVIPHMRENVHAVFEETERHRFILKITDKNNRSWTLGTPDAPLRFSFAAENVDSSSNSYQVDFSGTSSRRARGFM